MFSSQLSDVEVVLTNVLGSEEIQDEWQVADDGAGVTRALSLCSRNNPRWLQKHIIAPSSTADTFGVCNLQVSKQVGKRTCTRDCFVSDVFWYCATRRHVFPLEDIFSFVRRRHICLCSTENLPSCATRQQFFCVTRKTIQRHTTCIRSLSRPNWRHVQ